MVEFPSSGLIIDPSRPLPHERPPEKPEQQSLGMTVAGHIVNDIVTKISRELDAWRARHHVPDSETHAHLSGKPGALTLEISHRKAGLRIIGTPTRRLTIRWSVG